MSDRELDALVEERVMGSTAASPVPAFTTDAAADHRVLAIIQGWDVELRYAWSRTLHSVWSARARAGQRLIDPVGVLHYRPGDYSRAALAALDGHGSAPRS